MALDSDIYGGGVCVPLCRGSGLPAGESSRDLPPPACTQPPQHTHNPGHRATQRAHPETPPPPSWPRPALSRHSHARGPCIQASQELGDVRYRPSADPTLGFRGDRRVQAPTSPRGPADQPRPTETTHGSWWVDSEPGSFIYTVKVTSEFLRLEQLWREGSSACAGQGQARPHVPWPPALPKDALFQESTPWPPNSPALSPGTGTCPHALHTPFVGRPDCARRLDYPIYATGSPLQSGASLIPFLSNEVWFPGAGTNGYDLTDCAAVARGGPLPTGEQSVCRCGGRCPRPVAEPGVGIT